MQHRLHPRVRLRLPARLRWSAPLGQQTERCETINVSRGGLLIACHEAHRPGHPLWVTFPFDSNASGAPPESIARVVRSAKANGSEPAQWNVAIEFEGSRVHHSRGAAGRMAEAREQNGNGNGVALPVHVRQLHIPWFEETMTVEVAPDQLKFRTNREYQLSERLMISFAPRSDAPWSGDGEWETEVVAIEVESGNDTLQVTVRKKSD